MRKVFVAVPPKYGLDDDGVRAHERNIEEAAHIAEKILDQYIEVKNLDCSFLKGDYSNSKNVKGFLFNTPCKKSPASIGGEMNCAYLV